MVLGLEAHFTRGGLINKTAVRRAVGEALEPLADVVTPGELMGRCGRDIQQALEILRAMLASRLLGIERPIVLLDEPTAALVGDELTVLFELLTRLRGAASFLFVSHRLAEINQYCDRAYVLKDGVLVAERPAGTSESTLHRLMVGRDRLTDYYAELDQAAPAEETVVRGVGLTGPGFADITLQVRAGEIVGVGGVVGSGKEALGRALAGLVPHTGGELTLASETRAAGLVFVPSDRRQEGAIDIFDVARNISLSSLRERPFRKGPFIARSQETRVAAEWIDRMGIRTRSAGSPMGELSGGNQQKVILARAVQTGARAFVLDNPTRGVDAGAKAEIYRVLRRLASNEGCAIILISDDLSEVIGLSHRIMVMKDGLCQRWFDAAVGEKPTEEDLIAEMV